MPRHITESPGALGRYDSQIKALVRELKSAGEGPQPLILENVVQPGPVRYVTVIWDRWKDVPEDVRPQIVLVAYERAESKGYADTIMTAEAATAAEALSLGLLPYGVAPARRSDDPIGVEEYRGAFAEETKRTVLGSKAKELRYARREDAEAAQVRLTGRLPGSHWTVFKQAETPDS
ncbi:MAG: hypothetical protein J0I06_24530 [Planctomycetes bacterium]|nr:hypothetical protein [Planctomycetota bacterium]